MRVVLCGGGTGGHVYPALALAHGLAARWQVEILYIGSSDGLEARIVPEAGISFTTIPVRGLVGKSILQSAAGAGYLLLALVRSVRLLRRFRPHAVVGTGGYVAGPPVWTAAKMGIPTLIHEQNAVPGVTNRMLSRMVDAVAIPFAGVERAFPAGASCFLAGNPVRPEVLAMDRAEGRRRLDLDPDADVVLVTSGSRGARRINEAVMASLPRLLERPRTVVLLVAGQRYFAQLEEAVAGLAAGSHGRIRLYGYLNEMPAALAAADLVVSRAGGMTLAEITARGLPAVLVPSPNVTHDHQSRNAALLADAGAAIVLNEADLTGETLVSTLSGLLQRPSRRRELAQRSKALGRPDATERILDRLDDLCRARAARSGSMSTGGGSGHE